MNAMLWRTLLVQHKEIIVPSISTERQSMWTEMAELLCEIQAIMYSLDVTDSNIKLPVTTIP